MKLISFVGLDPTTNAELDKVLAKGVNKPAPVKVAAKPASPTGYQFKPPAASAAPISLIQPGSPAWHNLPPAGARLGITNSQWSVYQTVALANRQGQQARLHTEWLKTADEVAQKLNQHDRSAEIKTVLTARNVAPARTQVAVAAPGPKPAIRSTTVATAKIPTASSRVVPKASPSADPEVRRYQTVMASIKGGSLPAQDEIEAAAVVATRLGHKRSMEILDRASVLHSTGTDPKALATYKNVAASLRAGNMPSQAQIDTASNTISRLSSRPDVLGYVPAGVPIGEWKSYFSLLASHADDDRTTIEQLKAAQNTAQKAGHARIARGIARSIAKKQTPAQTGGSPLVAKRKITTYDARGPQMSVRHQDKKNRPYEPKHGKFDVSDKEYANYAAVQNAIGVPNQKIAISRLQLAKKTAAAYGHRSTADMLDERLAAAGAKKPVLAKASPKVHVGPAVITKPQRKIEVGPAVVTRTGPQKPTGRIYDAKSGWGQNMTAQLKPSDVKKASQKYDVPPKSTMQVLKGAKAENPIAAAILAAGHKMRSWFTPTHVKDLQAQAPHDPEARKKLAGLAAAEAVATAQSRAPSRPTVTQIPSPAAIASIPVTPTPSEISRGAGQMGVPAPMVAEMALKAKKSPEAAAKVAEGADMMQAASKGDPEAKAQIAEIKKGAESGDPAMVEKGVALAAAGAATVALAKRSEPAQQRQEESKPAAPKAQVMPGEPQKTGTTGLVVAGLALGGLAIAAMSQKTNRRKAKAA